MNIVSESSVSFDEFFVLRVHRRSLIAKIRNHPCYGVAQHGDELRSGKGCPDLNGVLHRQVTGGGSELDWFVRQQMNLSTAFCSFTL
jgi:hypothetical protein